MEVNTGTDEILKVEVVNFDNIRDNTTKVVIAAIAGTIVTKITEEVVKSILLKRKMKKLVKANEKPQENK